MARLDTSYSSGQPERDDGDFQLLDIGTYRMQESGIEFQSQNEIGLYTEMHLQIVNPETQHTIKFKGVVIGCSGDKHKGYQVSLIYTNLTQETQMSLFEMYWAQM